jgi:phosphate transport system protein
MPRVDFEHDLRVLQDEAILLGSMVEKAVVKSMDALRTRDLAASAQVIRDDDVIDRKRFDLEERCIDLIARQQPLAKDLRLIVAILHISVELERIGDYAEGIGKIGLMMGEEAPLKPLIDLPRMGDMATKMLRQSLDSLVRRDVSLARAVCTDDDNVDALYEDIYKELIGYMVQDPSTIRRATYLLWAAHDMERIADRTTNIAERVIYLVTGKMVEVNISRY